MKKTKDLVVSSDVEMIPQERSVENMITLAIDKGLSVEAIEKLIAMRRELKEEFAREEFFKAMANFQDRCPTIAKTKDGGKIKETGKVAYKYAPIEDVANDEVKKLIAENGFSYTFESGRNDRFYSTCVVHHIAGHTERTTVEVSAVGKTGVMSDAQYEAAAMSFAQRYAFRNAFGIIVGGEDNENELLKKENERLTGESVAAIAHFQLLIQRAKTIEDLGLLWESIPGTLRVHLVETKEEAKKNLKNENRKV
jgi:hypothetical protein